ncbi:hypothetical protein KAH55_01110 [bacterium]|nr:hypothetical protein [bacterium]
MKQYRNHWTRIGAIVGIMFLLFSPFNEQPLQAHPLDISYTTLVPKAGGLEATLYLHSYEVSLIAQAGGVYLHKAENFSRLPDIIKPYVCKHFQVSKNGQALELQKMQLQDKSLAEIVEDGIFLKFFIPPAQKYHFRITLFVTDFQTQVNKVLLLAEGGRPRDDIAEIVFTRYRTEWVLNMTAPDFSADIDDGTDQDRDGLTDHWEQLLGTNPEKTDSDLDGFSDYDEFSMGWPPNSRYQVKGQRRMYLFQIDAINSEYRIPPCFSDSSRYYTSDEPIVFSDSTDSAEIVVKKDLPKMQPLELPMNDFWLKLARKIDANSYPVVEQLPAKVVVLLCLLIGLLWSLTKGLRFQKILQNQLLPEVSWLQAVRINTAFVLAHLSDVLLGLLLWHILFSLISWNGWLEIAMLIGFGGLILVFVFYAVVRLVCMFRHIQAHRFLLEKPIRHVNATRLNTLRFWRNSLRFFSLRWVVVFFILVLGRIDLLFSGVFGYAVGVWTMLMIAKFFSQRNLKPVTFSRTVRLLAVWGQRLILLVLFVRLILPVFF